MRLPTKDQILKAQIDILEQQLTEAKELAFKRKVSLDKMLTRAERAEAERDEAINGTLGCLCCYSVSQENKRLRGGIEHLRQVGTGEAQVADDDTSGMNYVSAYCEDLLSEQALKKAVE